jgi:uncharacterized membrane protein YhaH (DUF805 family)
MRQLIEAVRHNLRNLPRFSGRERRGSFWRFALAVYLAQMALSMLMTVPLMAGAFSRRGPEAFATMFDTIAILSAVSVGMFVLLLAASAVRRLHDSGRSGLWMLLPLPFLATALWGMHEIRSNLGEGADPDGSFGLLLANNVVYLAVVGFLIFLLARPGTVGTNRYGPDPREERDSSPAA